MNKTAEQYRIWTITDTDQTPPKVERVEAQFVSYGTEYRQVFLQEKGKTHNPMLHHLADEDREFLNKLFETVGYSLDSTELPQALKKDEGSPIGVLGKNLVNLRVAQNVLFQEGVVTDVELSQLKRMPNLNSLSFMGNQLIGRSIQTDESLETLAKWNQPKKLYFTISNISDAGMQTLSRMKHLELLYFEECHQITDNGLARLGKLDSLKALIIKRCRGLGENPWPFIGRLAQLEHLWLFQFHISDELLKQVGKLSSLRELRLQRCGENTLSDLGIAYLGRLKQLTHLLLSGFTNITDEGIAQLENALPGLEIWGWYEEQSDD